jgi:AraC family transcriptional regulator, ethanolamine operon transcriptional activator
MRSVYISPGTFGASLTVEDPDAMANAMTDGLRGEYLQLEAKPFSGSWTTLRFDRMVIQFGREDVATVRRLRVPADRAAFVVPIATTPLARWNARPIAPHQMVACMPGAECFAFDPGGTHFAIVSVPLGSPIAAAARDAYGSAGGSTIITPAEAAAFELLRYLETAASLLDVVADEPPPMHGACWAERLLLSCLESASAGRSDADPSKARSLIVGRAEAFYRSHVGEPVSIARLSTVVGVSERSLRNAFYDVYTTSPKRYLKLWQLHQVRRELRAAHSSVTDVATFNGFYELGRFAGEYKALFGEVPSVTLHRAKARHSPHAASAS